MEFETHQAPWLSNANPALFLSRVRQFADIALQPIVDVSSGRVVAYESLLRDQDRLGFPTIADLFNHAFNIGLLVELESEVHAKALEKFADLDRDPASYLFLNVDGRLISRVVDLKAKLNALLRRSCLRPSNICIEISEANQYLGDPGLSNFAIALQSEGYRVAIDDYGAGYSGLRMLYEVHPDFLKIDGFFVRTMESDSKKRLLVATIVDLAHTLGVSVIAEGVETEEELHCCRRTRCDLVQGHYVAPPTKRMDELSRSYPNVVSSNVSCRPRGEDALQVALAQIETLRDNASMVDVIKLFHAHPEQTIIPILEHTGRPKGVIRERDIKPFLYSPFGRELLQNRSCGYSLNQFLRRIPVVNIKSQLNHFVQAYYDRLSDGVLVTDDARYVGYVSAEALLAVINNLRFIEACDANPLTGLPGNEAILSFIGDACEKVNLARLFCYFDFDNFKPFNDTYGFRVGDRAILLFADLLKALKGASSIFIGHIGGDDFFAGAIGKDCELVMASLKDVQHKFDEGVKSFYDADDRARGYIEGIGRDGSPTSFPLMTCSVAAIQFAPDAAPADVEHLTRRIAELKKQAKASSSRFAKITIGRQLSAPSERSEASVPMAAKLQTLGVSTAI